MCGWHTSGSTRVGREWGTGCTHHGEAAVELEHRVVGVLRAACGGYDALSPGEPASGFIESVSEGSAHETVGVPPTHPQCEERAYQSMSVMLRIRPASGTTGVDLQHAKRLLRWLSTRMSVRSPTCIPHLLPTAPPLNRTTTSCLQRHHPAQVCGCGERAVLSSWKWN